jgi:hypothetical protein
VGGTRGTRSRTLPGTTWTAARIPADDINAFCIGRSAYPLGPAERDDPVPELAVKPVRLMMRDE